MSITTATYKPRILDRMAKQYTPNQLKRAGEAKRIELLGQMSERHQRALTAGDKAALLELAAEYLVLGQGCPGIASTIMIEAENLE